MCLEERICNSFMDWLQMNYHPQIFPGRENLNSLMGELNSHAIKDVTFYEYETKTVKLSYATLY